MTTESMAMDLEPGELHIDQEGYVTGAHTFLEPTRLAHEYVVPLASSSAGTRGPVNHWFNGTEHEMLEEFIRLKHTCSYV